MKDSVNKDKKSAYLNFSKLSPLELRIIGISLSVLSIGIAIAWIGLMYLSSQ